MKYGYYGQFQSTENLSGKYDPENDVKNYYCNIYPEIIDEYSGAGEFGGTVLRARISPVSLSAVMISGYKGIFEVLPYNNEFVLLENFSKRVSERKKFLISAERAAEMNLKAKRG